MTEMPAQNPTPNPNSNPAPNSTPTNNAWWPDVKTEVGRKSAIAVGAFAGAYIAVSYLLLGLISFATGNGWIGHNPIASQLEIYIGLFLHIAVCGVAFGLNVWMRKKESRIAACLIALWIGAEIIAKLDSHLGNYSLYLSALFTLCAINGVRGTFAPPIKPASKPPSENSDSGDHRLTG